MTRTPNDEAEAARLRQAARFRQWVEDSGLGHAKIAELIGCNPSYVSLLASGDRTPSLRTAARIEHLTRRLRRPILAVSWVPEAASAA